MANVNQSTHFPLKEGMGTEKANGGSGASSGGLQVPKTAVNRLRSLLDWDEDADDLTSLPVNDALAWKRWLLFGPILLACLLAIFMAGPRENQTSYLVAQGKEPPMHRQATYVEQRQADTRNRYNLIETWHEYEDVDYESMSNYWTNSSTPNLYSSAEAANCSAAFLGSLWPDLDSVTHTDPDAAVAALERLHLRSFRPAIRVLGNVLLEPTPVTDFVARVKSCVASNAQLVEWGCRLAGQSGLHYRSGGGYIEGNGTTDFVTYLLVLEKLTAAAVEGAHFAETMAFAARTGFEEAGGRDLIIANWNGTEDGLTFVLDKVTSIQIGLGIFQELRKLPDNARVRTMTELQNQWRQVEQILELNILEASTLDNRARLYANAYTGLSLAADVTSRGILAQQVTDSTGTSVRTHWPLGKDWVDTYNSWNTAFVLTHLRPENGQVAKLFIPSVMCTDQSEEADEWISARTYSLFLTSHESRHEPVFPSPPGPPNPEYLRQFGDSNLANIGVPEATNSEVRFLISSMPSTLSLAVWVDTKSWAIITCFTLWGSTMLLAWGMEIISAALLSQSTEDSHGSLLLSQRYWRVAELCFPFFLSIAVFSRSVFGLPFMVAGLWKLGCPETISYLAAAHLKHGPDGTITLVHACGKFFFAIGTFFHHSSTALFITAIVTGAFSMEADPDLLYAITLPLIYQHWAIKLKHVNFFVYVAVLLGLEIWWEIEVFAALPHFRYWHEQRCAWGMLVGHWCFWAGGSCLELSKRLAPKTEEAKSKRGTMLHMAEVLHMGTISYTSSTPTSPTSPM